MNVIAGCVIVKNNKILLVKEGMEEHYGKWNLPAGRVDDFERITDGAIRETFEETGLKVKLIGVLPIGERIIKNQTFISVRFVAEVIGGELKVDCREIIDAKWFDINEIETMIPKELRSYEFNKQVIQNYKNNKIYSIEIFDNKQYIN